MNTDSPLRLFDNVDCIPSIHGRSVFAQEVRRAYLGKRYSCVAVELPPSLGPAVLEAVELLPVCTAVVYTEPGVETRTCYVPVTPADSIMEALRLALRERAAIEYVDLETPVYEPDPQPMPDEYAVRGVGLEGYYRAVAPTVAPASAGSQRAERERWMAGRLRELASAHQRILFVCGLAHLEGIRRAVAGGTRTWEVQPPYVDPVIHQVHPDGLYFLMGEIPYLAYLYERCRSGFDLSDYDQADGIKELLLEARTEFGRDFPEEIYDLSPATMQTMLTYLRNLCLIEGRFTPALYELVVAAKGVGGGAFAAQAAELARFYPYMDPTSELPVLCMGIDEGILPGSGRVALSSRLPGPPVVWKNVKMDRRPKPRKRLRWRYSWNPFGQCSWPPEDERIENFVSHVRKRSRGLIGEDQARTEKFSSSIKDGIDIRETMRNWHTGDLYVKEVPPVRGDVGAVVFVFEEDDGSKYPWCATWQAEHANESTLCFYATDYRQDMVGPGIGRSYYGGALFIFPPRPIPDIWTDEALPAPTLMDRLALAGLAYSEERFVAYVAARRPSLFLRTEARRRGRHLIYMPLASFSQSTLRRLRRFHVLNGRRIRSFAREYIA